METREGSVDETKARGSNVMEGEGAVRQQAQEGLIFHEETIDLGGDEFESEGNETISEDSNNFLDKLNEHMMESVIISDSPNNSEDDTSDFGCLQEIVKQVEVKDIHAAEVEVEKEAINNECENAHENASKDISDMGIDDQSLLKEELIQEATNDELTVESEALLNSASNDITENKSKENSLPTLAGKISADPEPILVCTIFSQTNPANGQQQFLHDGFEPQMVKSPSFGGVSETPVKIHPQTVQPSPSLSKFFGDAITTNTLASDFFDSFTTSSFISVSNPNASSSVPEQMSSLVSAGAACDSSDLNYSAKNGRTEAARSASSPEISQSPKPFSQIQTVFQGNDDPFATVLNMSEIDRRNDAWLSSEGTRNVLISVATQQYSTVFIDKENLTMPGLKFDNIQVRNFTCILLH